LDKIAVRDVNRFEESMLKEMRDAHSDVLETIRTEAKLSDEITEKLNTIIGGIAAKFA